mmetsp:Transcript_131155/g.261767  ORF Transcript_131155/g.261767 Transcript_131155/m.261767 type:complete len:89 (-) Transcript_131155:1084-1350(-)
MQLRDWEGEPDVTTLTAEFGRAEMHFVTAAWTAEAEREPGRLSVTTVLAETGRVPGREVAALLRMDPLVPAPEMPALLRVYALVPCRP